MHHFPKIVNESNVAYIIRASIAAASSQMPVDMINYHDQTGYSIFLEACKLGLKDAILRFIKAGANPNLANNKGNTPLLSLRDAAASKDIVQLLLERGANPNLADNVGNTPLLRLCHYGKDIVQLLLERGANPNLASNNGLTPLTSLFLVDTNSYITRANKALDILHVFVGMNRNTEFANSMNTKLKAQFGTNERDKLIYAIQSKYDDKKNEGKDGVEMFLEDLTNSLKNVLPKNHPLEIYKNTRQIDIMKLLIDNGADVNIQDAFGATPLHKASSICEFTDVVKLLIDNGADVNIQSRSGETPLHRASRKSTPDVAKLLIDNGADVNIQDRSGETPLHKASRQSTPDVVKLLIDNGADVNIQDRSGETPLHKASSMCEFTDVVKLLIDNGADVNIQDRSGETPLHKASRQSTPDIVKLLIDNGADVTIQDKSGATPLHIASSMYEFTDLVKLLIDNGAHINSKSYEDYTPLTFAIEKDDIEMVNFLVEEGAINTLGTDE